MSGQNTIQGNISGQTTNVLGQTIFSLPQHSAFLGSGVRVEEGFVPGSHVG